MTHFLLDCHCQDEGWCHPSSCWAVGGCGILLFGVSKTGTRIRETLSLSLPWFTGVKPGSKYCSFRAIGFIPAVQLAPVPGEIKVVFVWQDSRLPTALLQESKA